ncbi:glycosyltransferase family 2 protein [Paracoccus sp. (in: a-proteobacteria)]|uniref:glycosyltransferase family 2 protein n=1 Tax=Paracoccus sp. TaxID=267 RepID=UPI0028A17E68|nr:glycosyltransferase family 2 protein [Paracoccus sp. (in: a-proteobacteria)]
MAGHQGSIAILMALYNGERHLRPQLDSLAAQSRKDWVLLIGDDGSTDASPQIVRDFASACAPGQVQIHQGPGEGPAANFRHLINQIPDRAEYAAFCDQDDVWLPDKLARAGQALAHAGEGPAIWCSRVTICAADLTPIALTPGLRHAPGFRNALIQNIVIGHTLMLNRAACDLVREAESEAGPIAMHDWWIYQLVTGAGGRVLWEDHPSTLYRQHGGNQVGASRGPRKAVAALRRMVSGEQRSWNQMNLAALLASAHRLTPDNRLVLSQFAGLHAPRALLRLAALRQGGFRRQSRMAQAALWLGAAFGWV